MPTPTLLQLLAAGRRCSAATSAWSGPQAAPVKGRGYEKRRNLRLPSDHRERTGAHGSLQRDAEVPGRSSCVALRRGQARRAQGRTFKRVIGSWSVSSCCCRCDWGGRGMPPFYPGFENRVAAGLLAYRKVLL